MPIACLLLSKKCSPQAVCCLEEYPEGYSEGSPQGYPEGRPEGFPEHCPKGYPKGGSERRPECLKRVLTNRDSERILNYRSRTWLLDAVGTGANVYYMAQIDAFCVHLDQSIVKLAKVNQSSWNICRTRTHVMLLARLPIATQCR